MRFDDETAGTLLSQLDEDPPVPSTVDIPRAVADGRLGFTTDLRLDGVQSTLG